ncbi:TonB-dependent receptor [Croceicoccus mobilis]|uniref:TonB-dependent receptor n=1 Tax=Croceicoccus mobilis TaxID=1703339 RepID=A0A916YXS1_9SPHN|nr:TonB-dependent receptor [Croceicoccus mobilis]GGD66062.1 TonB-dependent receptor [Croceicoccus mobilis]
MSGASALALAALPAVAMAQDTAETQSEEATAGDDVIVVTGIRASLRDAMNIKRDGQGVVDAISAEDIGKFPDTNLAESLQRITGVSIDRSNGEGSTVTVRGFGPEFNLVTLNGRQMPTSTLGDGASPPSSRSFDFANLASEGVAAVEVYKTGRADVPSGGIGSTINIRTPRPLDKPGLSGSVAVKGVLDSSRNSGNPITPEVSGILSSTFADDRIGILVAGSYQDRKASVNTASVGWRDGYLGSENNWGSLAQEGSAGYDQITNRPGPNDVYAVPQNASYTLTDIDRERINGQAVLQYQPTDTLTATLDYTFSQNTVEARSSDVGIWFNFANTSSAWTDGPVAGPIFYSENFGTDPAGWSDLSYSGALVANRSINKSLGFNLEWEPTDRLSFTLDAHDSSAESKPTNKYGTSVSVGTAVFGLAEQGINFENDLPVIYYTPGDGIDPNDPAERFATGQAFRNAYFKDEIRQVQISGRYDADMGFLKSVDFGATYTENKVRSAYGFLQNETWGGIPGAGPGDIPDDIFYEISLPDKFSGLSGSNDPAMIQSFYGFNFEDMVTILDDQFGICDAAAVSGTCLADYNTDRRIKETTWAPYIQFNNEFDLMAGPAHVIAGLRYENTDVDSSALVPIPETIRWVSVNEFAIDYGPDDYSQLKGGYDFWLPSIDFDFRPIDDVVVRASYSQTITRPSYADLQGGQSIDPNPRIENGTGSQGNPGLLPYKSENFDASAEWYYGPSSYVSIGYFRKNVENFIGSGRANVFIDGVTNPASGPRVEAAYAALGADAPLTEVRQYIFDNYPESTIATGTDTNGFTTGSILSLPEDDPMRFEVTQPVNSDQTATIDGLEFAVQHSFWDTGFGVIANYTMVNGDAKYDNTQPYNVTQFALTGLSDSANLVGFYDKGPLQARVAWNWRDKFLGGTGPNPFYVEEYWQIDASASYEFDMGVSVFVEAINLTGESRRGHRRSDNTVYFASPGFARYAAGVRYNF